MISTYIPGKSYSALILVLEEIPRFQPKLVCVLSAALLRKMAGTQCDLPPDTATLEDYCEEWARWAAGLEKIKAQRTNQAELSAFQDDMDTIQAEIRQLQDGLKRRIRDHKATTEKRWKLYRACLEMHLRNLPPTDMLHLVSS